MLIADFDVHGRVADFDPATGRLGPGRTADPGQPTHGLADDLTPFVEAEHFDLGLFAANVLAAPERAARIYR